MTAIRLFSVRRLRIASGTVLFGFIAAHLLNHALGLVSVEAMEEARAWFDLVWRNPPALVLFYLALAVHFVLAMLSIYRRRTLKMPAGEALQFALGLLLPALLIPHIVAVRLASGAGEEIGYPRVVYGLLSDPASTIRQSAALVVAWIHGCLGLWFWLRVRPWFTRFQPAAYTVALLVPIVSLLGFSAAGKELAAEKYRPPPPTASASERWKPAEVQATVYAALGGALSSALLARFVRTRRRRDKRIAVRYADGHEVYVPRGSSVLEASRIGGIPHLAVCGGKGRCSTCRVQILEGLEALPPSGAEEAQTLLRIGAPDDVRLACQLRPTAALKVVPVLRPGELGSAAEPGGARAAGSERHLAVLFCDLRGFTQLTEKRLPFDTVFLLNRYFAAAGEAVETAGGTVDKFVGDGVMALFGLDGPQDEACAAALRAAAGIVRAVDALDAALADELAGQRLRVAIGMHTGPAIVGRMGYGPAASLTVVGDTINTASRLEGIAKDEGAELVTSVDLALRGGLSLGGVKRRILPIRGRADPLDVLIVDDARRLDERLAVS